MQSPILMLLSFASLLMSTTIQSTSYDSTLAIDGFHTEWIHRGELVDNGAFVAVANDDSTLYLCLRITDTRIARQMLRFGSTLWINSEGKRKKESGFVYPAPMTFDPSTVHRDSARSMSLEDLNGLMESRCGIDLGDEFPRFLPFHYAEAAGVEAVVSAKENALVYEIKMPFRSSEPLLSPFVVPDLSEEIRITFETGVPTQPPVRREMHSTPSFSAGGGKGSGGRGGGGGKGGRGGGGGKGGARPSGAQSQKQAMPTPPEPFELTVKVALVQ